MELPKPPEDMDLRNIIDKLANFVARNGPEFEHMTKQKQRDNPKFSFLYGGEFFNYYQYKVTTEQAIMKKMQQQAAQRAAQQVQQAGIPPAGIPPGLPPPGMPLTPWQQQAQHLAQNVTQVQEQLTQQRSLADQQMKQSESNLAAQYTSLIQQQQLQIEEAVEQAKEDKLKQLSDECQLPSEELDKIMNPIIESCTKDAISNGKNWIFTHNQTKPHGDLIAHYLMKRITVKEGPFELRLHLIYLINDVLHHCQRKSAEELKQSLGGVVVPIFCTAHQVADDDKKNKLSKLLNLWEQNKYFSVEVMEQMKDPAAAMARYQADLIRHSATYVMQVTERTQQQYAALQKQHQAFVDHLQNQLQVLQQSLQQAQQAQQQHQATVPPPQGPPFSSPPGSIPSTGATVPPGIGAVTSALPPGGPGAPPGLPGAPPGLPSAPGVIPPFPPPNFSQPPPNFSQPPPGFGGPPPTQRFDYGHGSLGPEAPAGAPPIPLPDFSKPPPGFPAVPPVSVPPPAPTEADLTPTVPYFELPAGLMAPLVKLEDMEYEPLDPNNIRLPPPMPPSDRLLAAVEAFYSPPSRDRPRDADGWEKLGLYEFFKAKQSANKLKDVSRKGRKSRSRSRSRSRSKSGSRSRSRSRSRSASPEFRRKARSRSRSPPAHEKRERSPSPPSFYPPPYQVSMDTPLDLENKGHQLMLKMGWGGGGLGVKEQGLVDPIKHADVRDRSDMYKGVGNNVDPFEQFRKSKSQGFIQRMRARVDETPKAPVDPANSYNPFSKEDDNS